MLRRSAVSRSLPFCAALLLALAILPTPASAELRAFFRAEQVNSGCWVDDQESVFLGDPERYFRMAVFDSSSSTVLNACASGCGADTNPSTLDGLTSDYCSWNSGCGNWNFSDRLISKIIPNSSGAYFYFGLFDEDSDADDSLGDHWFWGSGPQSGTFNNNNVSPYYPDSPISTVCGGDVEGIGNAGNFSVTYATWFEDSSGPTLSATLYHSDDGLTATGFDNDTRLDFAWGPAGDPQSGVSSYGASLWDQTLGSWVFYRQSFGNTQSLTVCSSGCSWAYTPVHGHVYQFQMSATNGFYPTIANQATSYSGWVWVTVDLSSPSSSITAPAAGSWQRSSFLVDFSDSDSGSGVTNCEWRVISNGSTTRPWAARTCNGSTTATLGPASYCRHQGIDTCRLSAQSEDFARRNSAVADRYFSIDWTADPIDSLLAFTAQGGTEIAEDSWTQDRDPFFTWTSTTAISPIAGYSWNLNADPDCVPDTGGGTSDSLQLPNNTWSDGVNSFRVRAIDEADNCGPVALRTVQVDATADAIVNLRADGAEGEVFDGVWQGLDAVDMIWDPSTSVSPVSGYSWSTAGSPDCVVDTSATTVLLTGLAEGITTFWVRAIDAAANCGPELPFDVAVDTVGDTVVALDLYAYPTGEPITPATWQADNDPYVTWSPPASDSPVAGYAIDVDQAPACAAVLPDPEYEFAPDALSNGIHVIQLLAIDAAGNCGAPATFEIWVNADAGTSPGDILGGLRVDRNSSDPQAVDLSWTASCSGVAIDYSIHEGTLGSWFSHAAKECSTGGALSMTITPDSGDRYFLVVPVSWSEEGTYGMTTTLGERPPSAPACMPVQAPPPYCP